MRTYDDMTQARRGGEGARLHGAEDQHRRSRSTASCSAYRPGFVVGNGFPERNWDAFIARSAAKTVEAFRAGCGPDVGIMLDLNFHFRTEGFRRIAEAVGPTGLTWLELDTHDPKSIALIRRDAPCPIASGETLLERRDFRPYFEAYAFDIAIVDVIWNGFYESLKIAAMADVYEVNVAPHNFYGHLASAITAHFCAAVPNFRIMEIDIDSVPWRDEFVDNPPVDRERRLHPADGTGLGRRGQTRPDCERIRSSNAAEDHHWPKKTPAFLWVAVRWRDVGIVDGDAGLARRSQAPSRSSISRRIGA